MNKIISHFKTRFTKRQQILIIAGFALAESMWIAAGIKVILIY